ncbi:response regulator [Desulfomicrobium escambiense]|uniref:response regulator n=1 Tax=Desulfomicrobium escambiense TaxID=29503 RepID=UPI00146FB564|nr:response regulator [Desulfomicrobium escambiense]
MNKGPIIVIVEEACLSRNVLVKALRAWGYDCAVAESEETAWAALNAAAEPRIVLTDWHADFLDCEEFFSRLRSDESLRGAFVMGGVPRGAVGAIRRCIAAGADDYVSRPYDLDDVRLRLHNAAKMMGRAPRGPVFPEE